MMQLPCSFKHLALCQFTPSVPVQFVARGLPYSTPPMRRATTTFPSGALSSSVPDLQRSLTLLCRRHPSIVVWTAGSLNCRRYT